MLDTIIKILEETVEILKEEQALPSRSGNYGKTNTLSQEKKMDELFKALIDAALEALADEIFGD